MSPDLNKQNSYLEYEKFLSKQKDTLLNFMIKNHINEVKFNEVKASEIVDKFIRTYPHKNFY
jgi:hypothetical protein